MIAECDYLRLPTSSTPISDNIRNSEYDFPDSPNGDISVISGIEELQELTKLSCTFFTVEIIAS